MVKVIGITGKSGSGKTTFASLLAKELTYIEKYPTNLKIV